MPTRTLVELVLCSFYACYSLYIHAYAHWVTAIIIIINGRQNHSLISTIAAHTTPSISIVRSSAALIWLRAWRQPHKYNIMLVQGSSLVQRQSFPFRPLRTGNVLQLDELAFQTYNSGLRTYIDNIICMRIARQQRFRREGYSVLNGEMSLLQLYSSVVLSAYRTRCMRYLRTERAACANVFRNSCSLFHKGGRGKCGYRDCNAR